jgi:D-alanyl-D-alanine dipeptidase
LKVLLALLLVATSARADSVRATLSARPDLVDARSAVPDLQVELRYARADNFLGEAIYGDLDVCYLHKDAAALLARAAAALAKVRPDLHLHVYDCARPAWVQRKMWALVRGTPRQPYVADPAKGSMHGTGCAVDITLADDAGRALDMGSPHDDFTRRAEPVAELELLGSGELTAEQVADRLLLREVMLRGGFWVLKNEWWHFDCARADDARRRYQPIP